MRASTRILLLLFALAGVSAGHAQAPHLNFKHLTTTDGLSDASVRSIAKDKYGNMWLGTVNGTCRYNSHEVKILLS